MDQCGNAGAERERGCRVCVCVCERERERGTCVYLSLLLPPLGSRGGRRREPRKDIVEGAGDDAGGGVGVKVVVGGGIGGGCEREGVAHGVRLFVFEKGGWLRLLDTCRDMPHARTCMYVHAWNGWNQIKSREHILYIYTYYIKIYTTHKNTHRYIPCPIPSVRRRGPWR